jgi:hypothetical protein
MRVIQSESVKREIQAIKIVVCRESDCQFHGGISPPGVVVVSAGVVVVGVAVVVVVVGPAVVVVVGPVGAAVVVVVG